MDTISCFSGKSYEKIVQKKDPGNRENGVHGARKPAPEDPGKIKKIDDVSPTHTHERK
jgi:hypothetical protein